MLINLKVKTLDAQTHEFSGINNEITVRDFKDQIAEKTGIAPEQQRIIYCGRVLADERHLKDFDVDGKVLHVAERPPPLQRSPSGSSSTTSNDNNSPRADRPNRHNMRDSPLLRALDGMVVGTMAIPINGGNMHNGPTALHPLTASSSFCMNRITVARHMLNCVNNIAAYLEDPSRGLNNVPLDILARGRWTMESTVVEVGITATDLPQSQNIVEMVHGAVSAAFRRNGNTNVTVVQLPTMFSTSDGDSLSAAAAAAAAAADGSVVATLESPDNNASSSAGGSSESEGGGSGGGGGSIVIGSSTGSGIGSGSNSSHDHHATVIIEDIIQEMDDAATNASSNVAQAGSTASSDSGSTRSNSNSTSTTDGGIGSTSVGTNTDDNLQSRRTGPSVLAEVYELLHTVWARIHPFIEQVQGMLQNQPVFDENDTVGRENAQRLFDRVSEAFHYLSHAQHAISDLMLDYAQPAPRFLTCRPILVEQSGYVSSNNYMSAAAAAAAAANALRQPQNPSMQQQQSTGGGSAANSILQGTGTAATAGGAGAASTTTNATVELVHPVREAVAEYVNALIDEPIDEPISVIVPNTSNTGNNHGATTHNAGTQSSDNHQLQMARLIQAVVNSAPVDTEFHVQINAPSIVPFGLPIGAAVATQGPNITRNHHRRPTATQTTQTQTGNNSTQTNDNNGSGGNGGSSSGNNEQTTTPTTAATTTTSLAANASPSTTSTSTTTPLGNQIRVNTATLPTTSTQTRSTSRPQVQIGNLPSGNLGGNGGRMLAPHMSAFDRFLPCNSHHIRENNEHSTQNNENSNANNNPNNGARTTTSAAHNHAHAANRGTVRMLSDLIRRSSLSVGSTMNAPRNNAAPYTRRSTLMTTASSSASSSPSLTASNTTGTEEGTDSSDSYSNLWETYCGTLRLQLLDFLNKALFDGIPMNPTNIEDGRGRAMSWLSEHLLYLRQYEKPEYDSFDSVLNILRKMWPLLIEAAYDRHVEPQQYYLRIKSMCKHFLTRMYSVLIVCIGRENADLFWRQLMRHLVSSVKLRFRPETIQFMLCFITTELPTTTDVHDAKQFVTPRRVEDETCKSHMDAETNEEPTGIKEQTENEEQPTGSRPSTLSDTSPQTDTEMDELITPTTSSTNQIEMMDPVCSSNATTSTLIPALPTVELPQVNHFSESWHEHFPHEWVPLLSRDVEFQTQQPPVPTPFSDGYISSASAKYRKTIQSAKPPTDLKDLIATSVQEAIQNVTKPTTSSNNSNNASSSSSAAAAAAAATAASSSSAAALAASAAATTTSENIAEMAATIADDPAIQAACKDVARVNIRGRLRNDKDYDPERFPQATKAIDKLPMT